MWPQHLMSHSSDTISKRSLKCDLSEPSGTQPVHLWKERNLNNREVSNKNRQMTTGSPRPIRDPPSCLFFLKQLDQIIIHQQVDLLEGMVQSLSPFNSAGTWVPPKGIQVLPPARWSHCEPSCCPCVRLFCSDSVGKTHFIVCLFCSRPLRGE